MTSTGGFLDGVKQSMRPSRKHMKRAARVDTRVL